MNKFSRWNPFRGIKERREEIDRQNSLAKELLTQSRQMVERSEAIYQEQRDVSDQLREQQSRNHFADLIMFGIPITSARRE